MPENSLVMMYLVFIVSVVSLAILIINPGQISPRFSTRVDVAFIVNEAHKTSSTDMVATVTNLKNPVETEAFATLSNGQVVKAEGTYTIGAEQSSTFSIHFSTDISSASELTIRELSGTADLWHFS